MHFSQIFILFSKRSFLLEFTNNFSIKNNIFDCGLDLIGINIVNRLQNALNTLNRTSNFISFVSIDDIDDRTKIALMKRTVPLDTLITIFGYEITSY